MKYTYYSPNRDRIHTIIGRDIDILLQRLPQDLWARLREVRFNDDARGNRIFAYVMGKRQDIAICALPPRISIHVSLTPEIFGSLPRCQAPRLALRRFMLYYVFLHELGHFLIISANDRDHHKRFANERYADEFAMEWRKKLWAESFDHPDPVHNPPSELEMQRVRQYWRESHTEYKRGQRCLSESNYVAAAEYFARALSTFPENTLALEAMGCLACFGKGVEQSNDKAIAYLQQALALDPALAMGNFVLAKALRDSGDQENADRIYKAALMMYPKFPHETVHELHWGKV